MTEQSVSALPYDELYDTAISGRAVELLLDGPNHVPERNSGLTVCDALKTRPHNTD